MLRMARRNRHIYVVCIPRITEITLLTDSVSGLEVDAVNACIYRRIVLFVEFVNRRSGVTPASSPMFRDIHFVTMAQVSVGSARPCGYRCPENAEGSRKRRPTRHILIAHFPSSASRLPCVAPKHYVRPGQSHDHYT